MLAIDFVFGGDTYLKSDGVKHIGHHTIFFAFQFCGQKYCFARATEDADNVFLCKENHDLMGPYWTKDEFVNWLKVQYHMDFDGLSFRIALSSFFRIYGKDNTDERRPLRGIPGQNMEKSIALLVALFDRNKDIQVYRQNLAKEKKKLDVFKETLKYHFVSSLVGGKDKYEADDMMKLSKYILTLFIVLAVIATFSGCEAKPSDDPDLTENKTTTVSHLTTVQNDTDLSRLQKTILDNNESVGIAYIGYVGYEANEQEVYSFLDNSQYADKYDFLCGSPLVNVGGAELYAVVIADTEYIASVYRAEITDNGEYSVKTDDAIYKYSGYGIDYFLLRCNESGIHSNVSLLFEKGNSSFSVFPMLSGMDGHLVAENFYDFSIYSDYGDDSEAEDKNVAIAREILLDSQEVQYYINIGMSVQYTGQIQEIYGRPCWIFALGTNRYDQFVRERYYGVCDNLVYFYDVLNDTWEVLGNG